MNVVGTSTRLLFCEGTPSSLDQRILNRLLIGRTGFLVIPAGGKHGLRAFIDGYVASSPNQHYIAFRDRDFDAVPPASPALIRLAGSKPIFLCHRACVESYLIDAALLDSYWSANHSLPAWKHGASPGVANLTQWIEDSAREIIAYQAVRWALARLKPGERWPELKTCWTSGSGHLPPSVVEGDCITEAKLLIQQYSINASNITETNFLTQFAMFQSQFSAAGFWTNRDFLVWFHGKDLKSAMQRLRPNTISLDHFCHWGADHFGWTAHADLQEIVTHL